jgi:glycosyltransferase involved in cell wall biosynthesis
VDELNQIFDNVFLSPSENLTPSALINISDGNMLHYDIVDLQFHNAAYNLEAFRQIASKVIFTPMESQAKVLFLDFAAKFTSGKALGFRRMASLINLAAEEIGFCRKADEVVCVSRADASFLRAVSGTRKIKGIDTGISQFEFAEALKSDFQPKPANLKDIKIIYIAYFGSETNVTALIWFLENVHPIIKSRVPGYILSVVGRGDMSAFKKFLDDSIELVGEVPAIAPHIYEARVGIAPALGGSGLRGKVNQYAILGVPCVVSPIALKGLAYRNGENVCVAENPMDFANSCIRLLTDLEWNVRIATAARQLCLARYSWQSKWPQIRAVYGIKV